MIVLPFLYQQQCTQHFCSTVQQSQPHITSHTNVALFVRAAAAAAPAAAAAAPAAAAAAAFAASLVIRGSAPTGSLHNHSRAKSLLCSMQGLPRMLKGSVLEFCPVSKSTAYLEGPPVRLGGHVGEEVGPGIAPQIGDWAKGAVGCCPAGTPACPTDPTGDVPVSHSLKQCLCRLHRSQIKSTNVNMH